MVLAVLTAAYALSRRGRGMYCGAISWKVDEFFSGLHIKDKHLARAAFIRIESSMTVKGESYVAWQ